MRFFPFLFFWQHRKKQKRGEKGGERKRKMERRVEGGKRGKRREKGKGGALAFSFFLLIIHGFLSDQFARERVPEKEAFVRGADSV